MKKLTNITRKVLLPAVLLSLLLPNVAYAYTPREFTMHEVDGTEYRTKDTYIRTDGDETFEVRGMGETKNLKGKVVENLKFGDITKGYWGVRVDGQNEVEIWDRNTELEFSYNGGDSAEFMSVCMTKDKNGVLQPIYYSDIENEKIKFTSNISHLMTHKFSLPPELKPVGGRTEIYGLIIYDFEYDARTLYRLAYEAAYDKALLNGEIDLNSYSFDPKIPYRPSNFRTKLIKFSTTEPKVSIPTATPTNSKVLVNGKEVSFNAFNIKGSNYFKLRDIAAAVNGTKKSFGVSYNNDLKAIVIDNSIGYSAGAEKSKGSDGKVKKATLNKAPTYVGTEAKDFQVYTIDGNNYYQLREICDMRGITLGWDGSKNTITLDTNESAAVVEPVKPEPVVVEPVKPEPETVIVEPVKVLDTSKYVTDKGVITKEYAKEFDLNFIDNTVFTRNSKGEVSVTITAPVLPAELKDYKYTIETRVEGYKIFDGKNNFTSSRTSFIVSQGETKQFTFEGVTDIDLANIDVRTEIENKAPAVHIHYVSTTFKGTVFETDGVAGTQETYTKDLSKTFVGFPVVRD